MNVTELLRCPVTHNSLKHLERGAFDQFAISDDWQGFGQLEEGLIDASEQYFYPIFNGIYILLENYAIFIGTGKDLRGEQSFDKKRVFDYYNEISYTTKEEMTIYEDSPKWVDFRDVSHDYISHAFRRAARYYPEKGQYLLDIASGPIGLEEYLSLSAGYDVRICVDISVNALVEAKHNLTRSGQKGIFICGDITNIPLVPDVCDAVLSQHTLYHLPRKDQQVAVEEMYRVTANKGKIVIVYSWFYHGWFMNLSLNLIQLYRIVRHFAGKVYVRVANSKPRLYFHAHSPGWFKKSFSFSKDIEFFAWRSTNKLFLSIYIHKWLFGKKILRKLQQLEDRYPKFWGRFGDYPVIVIEKKCKNLK